MPFLVKNPSSKIILEDANFILEDAETVSANVFLSLEVADFILEGSKTVSADAILTLEAADFILELSGLDLENAGFGLAIAGFNPDDAGVVRVRDPSGLPELPLTGQNMCNDGFGKPAKMPGDGLTMAGYKHGTSNWAVKGCQKE